jgi:hypothetical protein
VDQWLQAGAIVVTGLYAIFRLGRFIQSVTGDVKSMKRRLDNIEARQDTLEERCIEQHREHGP